MLYKNIIYTLVQYIIIHLYTVYTLVQYIIIHLYTVQHVINRIVIILFIKAQCTIIPVVKAQLDGITKKQSCIL